MKKSLDLYTIEEIRGMRELIGHANYDVYDKIMNHNCFELDAMLEKDYLLKEDSKLFIDIKQLNFFMLSYVNNKKMKLTEREVEMLTKMINSIDKQIQETQTTPTLESYKNEYRSCMLEFLKKTAHYELNNNTNNTKR